MAGAVGSVGVVRVVAWGGDLPEPGDLIHTTGGSWYLVDAVLGLCRTCRRRVSGVGDVPGFEGWPHHSARSDPALPCGPVDTSPPFPIRVVRLGKAEPADLLDGRQVHEFEWVPRQPRRPRQRRRAA